MNFACKDNAGPNVIESHICNIAYIRYITTSAGTFRAQHSNKKPHSSHSIYILIPQNLPSNNNNNNNNRNSASSI